jgi:hypothetical protein
MRKLAPLTIALALGTSACVTPQPAKLIASAPAASQSARVPAPSYGSPAFGNFVRTRSPQLQFCYEDTRASSPSLAGSATVAVTLASDGNVVNADIIRRSWSGKGSEVVETCMLSRVRGWRFPATNTEEPLTHSFAVIFTR